MIIAKIVKRFYFDLEYCGKMTEITKGRADENSYSKALRDG